MEQFNLHPLISGRWSPRVFTSEVIDKEKISSLFEAARWAPSARNSQPWRFIYASKNDGERWVRLLDILTPSNKVWAQHASHLVLACVAKVDLSRNSIRKSALYDLGLAVANFTFQANSLGIFVRNMGGFEPSKAIQNFSIPSEIEPVVVLALGYPDETISSNPDFDVPIKTRRERADSNKFVFNGAWHDLIW